MRRWSGQLALLWLTLGLSCSKVPLIPVNAGFVLADAAWFEEEQTLFVFAEVHAEQGLGDPSLIEISYTTDDGAVPWTRLEDFTPVHTHLEVDCGVNAMCGSTSIYVPLEPRGVKIRLRYHREGPLALDADVRYNVQGRGAAHEKRSLVVYGVFDEENTLVQWRARHQFPTLRNQEAERLGLRRYFRIEEQVFGTDDLVRPNNPYGYGVECPVQFEASGLPVLETTDRSRFNAKELPEEALDDALVCAQATVDDALGEFTTGAVARKNPEVRSAFPALRSPVRDATQLQWFLGPCDSNISRKHEDMQRQRLQMEDVPTTCTEGWTSDVWVDQLVVDFRDAIEDERPNANDMVLVIGLHQDEAGLAEAVEAALAQVLPQERLQNSPRVAGAFLFDSDDRGIGDESLTPVVLWCPSTLPVDEIPDASQRSCAVLPDDLDLDLGPFSFGALPILPTREKYLEFIDTYSVNQAGEVYDLRFRTPEFAATAEHIGLDVFGAATFLNNESISAGPDDSFSYCADGGSQLLLFRSPSMRAGSIDFYQCYYSGIPPELCASAAYGATTLDVLPVWHQTFREPTYDLGVFWEFPFLLQMEYRVALAGAVSAFGFSVPFGISETTQSYYGTELWNSQTFDLSQLLLQCTRWCDHPTFDGAGVYHPKQYFDTKYLNTCYVPNYPMPATDTGFPLDP